MGINLFSDKDVTFIEIKNNKNLVVTLCTLGASFYKIYFKGKNRIMSPINYEEFYNNSQYYGKLIGRFSGRIKDAKCVIANMNISYRKIGIILIHYMVDQRVFPILILIMK